jgi:UDP-glucose 4-epimerase
MPDELPLAETHATKPVNVYGRTKLAVENFLTDMAATGAIRTALLRYFNAAGADIDGDIGELHNPETHLVPLAIQAALRADRSLSVFGTDYPTADGTCERDYVHVEDLAEAYLQALAFLETTAGSRAFNLGTGQPVSVRQVLQAVERAVGAKVPTVESPRRAGDPPRLFAAAGRAERELGWVATRSDIGSIVESAARWHRSNLFSEAV